MAQPYFTGQQGQMPRMNMQVATAPGRYLAEGIKRVQEREFEKAEKKKQQEDRAKIFESLDPSISKEQAAVLARDSDLTITLKQVQAQQAQMAQQAEIFNRQIKELDRVESSRIASNKALDELINLDKYKEVEEVIPQQIIDPNAGQPKPFNVGDNVFDMVSQQAPVQPVPEEPSSNMSLSRGGSAEQIRNAQPIELFKPSEGQPGAMPSRLGNIPIPEQPQKPIPAELLTQPNEPVASTAWGDKLQQLQIIDEKTILKKVKKTNEEVKRELLAKHPGDREYARAIHNQLKASESAQVAALKEQISIQKEVVATQKMQAEIAELTNKINMGESPNVETIKRIGHVKTMQTSTSIIEELGKATDGVSWMDKWNKSGWIPNFAKVEDRQRYWSAAEAWTMAILRNHSGGAVTPDEAKQYSRIFFPEPGESESLALDKKRQRDSIEQGLSIGLTPWIGEKGSFNMKESQISGGTPLSTSGKTSGGYRISKQGY